MRKFHIIFLLLLATPSLSDELNLCGDRVVVKSLDKITLTDSEKTLVCGDDDTVAWSRIPPRQAAYFLKVFLSERGYHAATSAIDGERLTVESGPLIMAHGVYLESDGSCESAAHEAVKGIDIQRYWQILGAPITRKALDGLEKWVKSQLAEQGMPCANVTIAANPKDGLITVTVSDARVLKVPRIEADRIPGLNAEIQRRFYAFDEGDVFNGLEFDLSARRIVEADLVLSSSFSTQCTPEGTIDKIHQRMIAGEPQLVSFGIGFDTEEYAIADASWKHTRLGVMASNATAALRASYLRQTAKLGFDWYYAPVITQHFIRSIATFERKNERREDTRSLEARTGPVWQRDLDSYNLELFAGLAVRHIETIRGVGPTTSDSVLGLVDATLTSHDYEYYAQAPRAGQELNLQVDRARKGAGSDISFSRYELRATALHTLFQLDPPVWVLGLRATLASTILDKDTSLEKVPLTLRNFLGGSRDLRGFGRLSLPATDEGALTTVYAGTELRVREVLPYNLHPFIFVDGGRYGGNNMVLDPDIFWSPGLGLQWQSPIGTFRTTLAHGLIDGPNHDAMDHLERWQFYFSFGEQF